MNHYCLLLLLFVTMASFGPCRMTMNSLRMSQMKMKTHYQAPRLMVNQIMFIWSQHHLGPLHYMPWCQGRKGVPGDYDDDGVDDPDPMLASRMAQAKLVQPKVNKLFAFVLQLKDFYMLCCSLSKHLSGKGQHFLGWNTPRPMLDFLIGPTACFFVSRPSAKISIFSLFFFFFVCVFVCACGFFFWIGEL